jgi:hypothetical protein
MAKSHHKPVTVAKGQWGTVECAARKSGRLPAIDFLDELREFYIGSQDKNITAYTKFLVLFQQMAENGKLSNKRFSFEGNGLYAFKHELRNVQIRFPCFQDGRKWILTHGFKKRGAQKGRGVWPEEEVKRAKEIRKEYFELKEEKGSENGKDFG